MEQNMNEELWRVQLSTGEIRMMTLEALDQAFDEGLIDARVPVLAPGASAWTTLGEAAGLDDVPTEQTPSLSPVALAAPSSAQILPTESQLDMRAELDLPDSFEELAPRRRGLMIGAAVAALAVAATIAVVAGKVGGSMPTTSDVTAAAVQAPPPAAVEALPAPTPSPAAQAAEPVKDTNTANVAKSANDTSAPKSANGSTPKSANDTSTAKPELSDWQKRMLLDADKAREDKSRAKKQEQAERAPKPAAKTPQKTSGGFLNGGDRFDPLNGAL
jgi:hypothetical protein